jgi:hypothetical protein
MNRPSVWCGDWIHKEIWSDNTVSEGTMTLDREISNLEGVHLISGIAYNMLHQESTITGTLKNDGQTLSGKWKNMETGKTGTFEWHHIPPASFRGHFTIQGNIQKYSWRGNKFTSGFEYIISKEIAISKEISDDTEILNMRTIFLSRETMSKIKNDKTSKPVNNKLTIIKALKIEQPVHILYTVENDVIGKWHKILTRIDNVLRKGYISARYRIRNQSLSTVKLKENGVREAR